VEFVGALGALDAFEAEDCSRGSLVSHTT
jgi:hypothetical protein